MKTIYIFWASSLFLSCFGKERKTRETDQINQRVTVLEQRMDSLIIGRDANPVEFDKVYNRCQAITKRGKQCKRKAKNKGYCWQHNG